MEKRTPHYKLGTAKGLIKAGLVRSTFSALASGSALGFDFEGIVEVVNALTMDSFYKSMTTYANNHIWQDVYKTATVAGEVYLKLTIVDELLIVSFKEL